MPNDIIITIYKQDNINKLYHYLFYCSSFFVSLSHISNKAQTLRNNKA